MHHAPPVSYPLGRVALQRGLWWTHTSVGLLTWIAWGVAQSAGKVWFFTGLAMGGLAMWGWRDVRSPMRHVCWDKGQWSIETPSPSLDLTQVHVGEVNPVLDLQSVLLLRWQPLSSSLSKTTRWLWLTQSACPDRWLDLRRAVYGSHP